jgi:hypothetical protein
MLSLAESLPGLPGLNGGKTYAAWPVWSGSYRDQVRFAPMPKKQAIKLYYKDRAWNRQKFPGRYGGTIGSAAMRVLECLIFDFPQLRDRPPRSRLSHDWSVALADRFFLILIVSKGRDNVCFPIDGPVPWVRRIHSRFFVRVLVVLPAQSIEALSGCVERYRLGKKPRPTHVWRIKQWGNFFRRVLPHRECCL